MQRQKKPRLPHLPLVDQGKLPLVHIFNGILHRNEICSARLELMKSITAARVVDLLLPVGPGD